MCGTVRSKKLDVVRRLLPNHDVVLQEAHGKLSLFEMELGTGIKHFLLFCIMGHVVVAGGVATITMRDVCLFVLAVVWPICITVVVVGRVARTVLWFSVLRRRRRLGWRMALWNVHSDGILSSMTSPFVRTMHWRAWWKRGRPQLCRGSMVGDMNFRANPCTLR